MFSAQTFVHTSDGLKPICEVRPGDSVLSFPAGEQPPSHKRTPEERMYKRVKTVVPHGRAEVGSLLVANLADGLKESISSTGNQPFFVGGSGWVPASKVGLMSALENFVFGNSLVLGSGFGKAAEEADVFTLTVEEFASYYVGSSGCWVRQIDVSGRST